MATFNKKILNKKLVFNNPYEANLIETYLFFFQNKTSFFKNIKVTNNFQLFVANLSFIELAVLFLDSKIKKSLKKDKKLSSKDWFVFLNFAFNPILSKDILLFFNENNFKRFSKTTDLKKGLLSSLNLYFKNLLQNECFPCETFYEITKDLTLEKESFSQVLKFLDFSDIDIFSINQSRKTLQKSLFFY